MPRITVSCPSGTHQFFYSIATPASPNTSAIDDELPVVVFIHSGYNSQEVFECQFADPELRRFNLVAIDLLGQGATLGFIGGQRYTPTETAQDFKCVMDALGLPPSHVFGLSMGGTVALELACAYPASVLSLTMCSPVSPTELEHILAGRMQVYRYWVEAFRNGSSNPEQRKKQDELLDDIFLGKMQLCYNNAKNRFSLAIGRCAMVRAIDIWSGNDANLQQAYDTAIAWFADRRAVPLSGLAKIHCPVNVIHCSEDIGYPLENAEALVRQLREAGIANVHLHKVAGPHYGNVVSAESINHIVRDTILDVHHTDEHWLITPEPEFLGSKMRTPWTALLRRFGYDPANRHR
ncbi:Alpha/Beta hydrolase protein [Coprinopsis sp. MPI-PUGE-AT-0042]|nr:Alpha/Beta hydrolase protein [Coprinopsis sp. MPI-PUGE-AT-0042]